MGESSISVTAAIGLVAVTVPVAWSALSLDLATTSFVSFTLCPYKRPRSNKQLVSTAAGVPRVRQAGASSRAKMLNTS